MTDVVILEGTGVGARRHLGAFESDLRLAVEAISHGPAPLVELTVVRRGSESQDQAGRASGMPWRRTRVGPGLVLVAGLDGPPTVSVTSRAPEPFGRLGLCSWKKTDTGDLVPEAHRVDLPPTMVAQPQALASLLHALHALVHGSFRDAIAQLEAVEGQVEPDAWSGFSLTYWLGLAHLDAGQCLGSTAHFEAATAYLASALSRRGCDTPRVVTAAAHRWSAQTHYQRLVASPERSCSAALDHIDQGLRLIDPSTYPVDRARLLYERASVTLYRRTAKDSRALEAARRDLTTALIVLEPDRFPLEHSHCENALGRLDAEWSGHHRREHQRSAALHYEAALSIRRRASHPWHYAQTQHNLGNLLLQQLEGDQAANADGAIRCFTEALSIFNADRFPHRHRQTMAGLGRAYLRRNGSAGDDLRRAISCFEEVAASVTKDSFPYLHGRTLFDLANARFSRNDPGEGDQVWAIEGYRKALQLFPARSFPVDRAQVLVALASALVGAAEVGQESSGAEALACYTEALQIFEQVGRSADAACVHACLAVLLLATRTQSGGRLHARALAHQHAAAASVASGSLGEAAGEDIEAFVRALVHDASELADDAEANRVVGPGVIA
jgi:tetratricopeptide (TPR) repeat protein